MNSDAMLPLSGFWYPTAGCGTYLKSLAVVSANADGVIVHCNSAAGLLLGAPVGDVVGARADAILKLTKRETGRRLSFPIAMVLATGRSIHIAGMIEPPSSEGTRRPVTLSSVAMRDHAGRIQGAVIIIRDGEPWLTPALGGQREQDDLTALLNQKGIIRHLNAMLVQAQIGASQGCLLYVKLDRVDLVNYLCGRVAGDRLIVEFATWLHTRLPSHLIGRASGSAFIVLLGEEAEQDGLNMALSIIESLQSFRFEHEGRTFMVEANIGISRMNTTASAEECISKGEAACRIAKLQGGGRAVVYRANASAIVDWKRRAEWSYGIQAALNAERLKLYVQKIVDERGNVQGYEVLARLLESDGVVIKPDAFLPDARRLGLMGRIDRAVFAQALSLIVRMRELCSTRPYPYLSVNLTTSSIADPLLRQWMLDQLEANCEVSALLWIEITETEELVWMREHIAFVEALRAYGVRVFLDDFGTGYNSFAVLKHVPIDGIKIDRMISSTIRSEPVCQALLNAALDLSAKIGITVVVEGVEDAADFEFLRESGVNRFQGYYFHRPEPADQLMQSLRSTVDVSQGLRADM